MFTLPQVAHQARYAMAHDHGTPPQLCRAARTASSLGAAHDLAREIGSRNEQFEALQARGRLRQATGDPGGAIDDHQRGLAIATELGQPDDQARADDGLAHAYQALHRPGPARRHWERALRILTDIGVDLPLDPEANAATIRANLASLEPIDGPSPPPARSSTR